MGCDIIIILGENNPFAITPDGKNIPFVRKVDFVIFQYIKNSPDNHVYELNLSLTRDGTSKFIQILPHSKKIFKMIYQNVIFP